ncbi:MAG: hypothetical protein JWR49_900 [Tardiphaga sp.]|nr:hypothetical protein [Tardiphaga sp.]
MNEVVGLAATLYSIHRLARSRRDCGPSSAVSDRRYVHQFLTINNGHDLHTSDAVAAIMSDVLLEPISHDGSREAFLREFTGIWERRYNRKGVAEYLWDFFRYEAENSAFQSLNDVAERILQRKPMTLRAFFQEHRALIY